MKILFGLAMFGPRPGIQMQDGACPISQLSWTLVNFEKQPDNPLAETPVYEAHLPTFMFKLYLKLLPYIIRLNPGPRSGSTHSDPEWTTQGPPSYRGIAPAWMHSRLFAFMGCP